MIRNIIAARLRLISKYVVPPQWEKELKEKGKSEEVSQSLIKEKVKSIKNKIRDKKIEKPGLFIRDLNKTISYISKMPDPARLGLQNSLSEFHNKIIPKARKGEILLSEAIQKDFLEQAEKLKDDGTLLKYLEGLFMEKYERDYKKRSLNALRRIARRIIYQLSISNKQ